MNPQSSDKSKSQIQPPLPSQIQILQKLFPKKKRICDNVSKERTKRIKHNIVS